jgi:hypothetical protein
MNSELAHTIFINLSLFLKNVNLSFIFAEKQRFDKIKALFREFKYDIRKIIWFESLNLSNSELRLLLSEIFAINSLKK